MVILAADVLGVAITSTILNRTLSITVEGEGMTIMHFFMNWILQIIFVRIIVILLRKHSYTKLKWLEIVFYLFLTLFEVGVFAYVSNSVQESTSGSFLIVMMIGFLVLDLYMMYILHQVSHIREAENKIALMHQQEKLQLQMYKELQKKYELSRSVAHDVKRHINSLQALVEENSIQRAGQYLSNLSETVSRLHPTVKNQNTMFAIILNTAVENAEKNHIFLHMDVEDFPMDFISDMDITTIFSNLLDNALEACSYLQGEKTIRLTLRCKLGLLVFRMVNPCSENTEALKGENHSGVGLINVRKTVERYGGVVDFQKKHGQFESAVTIPIPSKDG